MSKALIFITSLLITNHCHALVWQWHDNFTEQEQRQLKSWLTEVDQGIHALFGDLPYEPHVHLNRLANAREPVPWANTRKYRNPSASFHVDPSFSLEAFRSDWTGAHELSHLLFPYLGRSSSWFAEGIASYLQYQIMYASGVLTWDETMEEMAGGFDRGERDRRAGNMPIPDISRERIRAPKRMYWGGAAYFLAVDRRLAEHNLRLHDVIRCYVQCCWRMHRGNARTMMAQFDQLSGTTVFADTYSEVMTRSGFPNTEAAMEWLHNNPPKLQ